jgi:hypothetical protein
MHNTTPNLVAGVTQLFKTKSAQSVFLARQLLLSHLPASVFIEKYLQDNEGRRQDLNLFPMMKQIYNQLPQKLLLKCSRKTLKSTLLSNIICLNMIRWNHYKMLYVAPQEASTKYFSSNYVAPRFESPELKKIFIKGWEKNDVYEKIFADTHSAVLFKYAKEDATRCRGPATDHNIHDEVQDMRFDVLPIIRETMALSKFKREFFAGTPLTTDNTINKLWLASTQLEWATKCTGCNHWNMLTLENNPMRMIQKKGLSCSKCDKVLDTTQGVWVSAISDPNSDKIDLVGYHLAQPILPYFNSIEKEWDEIYRKVNDGKYGAHQIYNEVFGIAYDVGSKPITLEELQDLCVLGSQRSDQGQNLDIFHRNRRQYVKTTTGVDWGVNMITSRTAVVHGAVRTDGIYEVFDAKIFDTMDYKGHIKEIAGVANTIQSSIAADGGPDPIRAHELGELTHPSRMLIVRYGNGKLVQAMDYPKGAPDWKTNRFVLHRSDCLSFTFRMLKGKKVLFPKYSEIEQCMEDILAEFIEVKDGTKGDGKGVMNHTLSYSHSPSRADDFLHALTFALVTAYVAVGDPQLKGPSSSGPEASDAD